MEINNKSELTFYRFKEISHSCGFLFTEWGSTSIKLIAKVTLRPEVLSIVSVKIDSLLLLWASSLCNERWVSDILSLLNYLLVIMSLLVVLFDKCETINIDYWDEVILVLFEHLHRFWVLLNKSSLEQFEKGIKCHLDGD